MLAIKRGIISSFDSATYTASVLLLEATSATLNNVPISNTIDGTSALPGAFCAVLFFDVQNYTDAVIIACYPNSTTGLPTPPPGRITFVPGFQQFNGTVINAGSTSPFTLNGFGSGIPAGALGVLYKVAFTSPTAGAFIQLAPHGAIDITAYATVGNIQVASAFVNGGGLLQVDSSGAIDIKANAGNCTVTLYTHGYVI